EIQRVSANKKLKQGHFKMGIHYVNFMPILNHSARKRASLCPLAKSYQERRVANVFANVSFVKLP
ncbi:hypothetical protein, partial [Plesiomonas sp.]|uniref:hypothetical protein n=1 Tax=Plesiomonas sp. TaxID=2486279 RepID=UPI003F3E0861